MENAYEEHVCLCALQNQFGFEPKIPLALIDRLGSAAAVFSLDHDSLREIFGPYGKQDLITKQALDDADRILSTLPPILMMESIIIRWQVLIGELNRMTLRKQRPHLSFDVQQEVILI